MRLYKLLEEVEFPERADKKYINIRSIERIDVRPFETRYVSTGLRLSFTKKESVYTESILGDVEKIKTSGSELFVKLYNSDNRNVMIFPGMVIGDIFSKEK